MSRTETDNVCLSQPAAIGRDSSAALAGEAPVMEDSAHVHALLQIVCIVQMLPSALDNILNDSLVKLGEKGVKFWHGKLQPAFVQESRDVTTLTTPRRERIFTLLAAQTLDMTLEEGSSP
ncbi:hypothetical protein llap_5443 [Limosa lapponica baueri]|uniref:Uncharacterized protein n=1 Tax=Limosa lapponica baueri TaxID=1758121 RepID=A0A2I0UDY5_LIMLA|nr:hypothetical protein llap_5443 [Limosa lapponica baueri]